MEHEFWRERWRVNKIGFHQAEYNPFLVRFADQLPAGRVLVPLSGKSRDSLFLAQRGHEVIACELVEDAVRALYEENEIPYQRDERGGLVRYCGGGVTSYAGDFFALTPAELGPVAAVFDRAALVALPEEMRARYTAHLLSFLSSGGIILQVAMSYARPDMSGPPFSIPWEELLAHYGARCEIERLAETDLLLDNPALREQGVTAWSEWAARLRVR